MRARIANWLVHLARRIQPENEEVTRFYTERLLDSMITGQSFVKITRVNPYDVSLAARNEEPK